MGKSRIGASKHQKAVSQKNAKQYPINLSEYSNAFAIASHTSPPCGLCNISLKAYTIDRYPTQDSPNTYPLPTKELPLFVFPHGIKIACPSVLNQIKFGVSSDNSGQCPFPKFFSFNFTNSDGEGVGIFIQVDWVVLGVL